MLTFLRGRQNRVTSRQSAITIMIEHNSLKIQNSVFLMIVNLSYRYRNNKTLAISAEMSLQKKKYKRESPIRHRKWNALRGLIFIQLQLQKYRDFKDGYCWKKISFFPSFQRIESGYILIYKSGSHTWLKVKWFFSKCSTKPDTPFDSL